MLGFVENIWRYIFSPVEVHKVFTPNTAATLTYVRRLSIEEHFDRNYKVSGKQIIVYGHSGSGKTTFLERYFEDHNITTITIHCDAGMTFEQLLLNAFDRLNPYYQDSSSTSISHSLSLTNSVGLPNNSVENTTTKETTNTATFNRFLPPQLTPQRLAEELGKAKKVLVIEDFHKLQERDKKRIADMMKVFIDQANHYEALKIICIGAVDTAREMVKLDNNLKHRVYECEVPLLSETEIKEMITKGCKFLNIQMEDALIEKIIHFSNRLGTIAHQLCYDVCCSEQIVRTRRNTVLLSGSHFTYAVEAYIDARSDSLQAAYDMAIKDSLGWYILRTFSNQPHSALPPKTIYKRVNRPEHPYTENQVALKLAELAMPEIGIIRSHFGGAKYSVSDPFWGAFIKMRIAKEQADNSKAAQDKNNINLLLQNQDDIEAMLLKILLNKYSPRTRL